MSYLLLNRLKIRVIPTVLCLVLICYLILAFCTSLFVTVPVYIPLLSSVPIYVNQWRYTPLPLTQPNPNLNAAYIALVDGDRKSLDNLRMTVRSIEDSFNKNYHYPYIIFSADDLSVEYKELVSSLVQGNVLFEKVSSPEYGYAKSTSFFRAFLATKQLKNIEDNTEKFRFKSRFLAGTIYNHQSLENIDYFWRFEPATEYTSPIEFDPFQYMQDHDKQISFSMASYEQPETIPTLFKKVMQFKDQHPQLITQSNSIMPSMVDNGDYNRCFIWNNFQIAKTSFFKSEAYQTYFKFIDKQNGIFYERWSDAVIQSLAAGLFLTKEQVHVWEDIGYRFNWYYKHCPKDDLIWTKSYCKPSENFENSEHSCIAYFK